MRILFLSSIFPRPYSPNRGIYCLHLCKALSRLGEEVRVFSPQAWLEKWRHAAVPAPEGMTADYPSYFYPPKVMRSAYGWFMWRSVRRRLRQVLAEFRPDCIVSYWAHPDGEVAVRAAQFAGVPAATMVGGSDVLLLAGTARGAKIL